MTKLSLLSIADPISEGMLALSDLDLNKSDDNVIQFPKLKLAGNDTTSSGYWLMDLAIGTVFLARPKSDKHNFVCGEFALYEKYERCACLLAINVEGTKPMHVDMRRFSNQWEMVEIIKVIPQSQLGKPINNEPVINAVEEQPQ